MIDTRFIRIYRRKIEEAQETNAELLLYGNIPTFEAYREAVCYLRGLGDALTFLDEANKEDSGE